MECFDLVLKVQMQFDFRRMTIFEQFLTFKDYQYLKTNLHPTYIKHFEKYSYLKTNMVEI